MNKSYNYFKKNWVPIKDKWAGHLTQKIAHFGCLTSQRAESGHAALKVDMSKRMDLFSAFLHMHKYWTSLEEKTMLLHKIESRIVDTLMFNNSKLDRIRRKISRAALIAAHSACLAVNFETLLEEGNDVDESSCVCPARINFMLPCVHTVLGLANNGLQLTHINKRWHLSTVNYQLQVTTSSNNTASSSGVSGTSSSRTATSSSSTTTSSSSPVDMQREGTASWRKLLLKMELRFRQLEGNSEQTDHLEELIADVMKESESTEDVVENMMDKAILMSVSEDIRAPGRPKTEICHLPDWKKSRADQVESKVTTGKFLYLPKANNTNNKSRAPEQLSLKRRNVNKTEAVKKNEEASRPTAVKKRRIIQPDTDSEDDIFLVDQVVEDIGNIDIGSRNMCSANIHPQINLRFATEVDDVAAPLRYWFYNPGYTQLAADTFRRPVATYTDVVVEKDEEPMHKDPNFKRSLWNTILHFVPKPEFSPARVEDAIEILLKQREVICSVDQ
ncbi:hypothetical protein BD770DRAFT_449983 [Pilaira anomala]|nr:hypothetical protein BD770DRAFT_449983 [Pilaira anomala]